ncbi:MAG: hypothetical protein FJY88_02590 [Candidatus Eisenbacteria bacterium]|nr:hypothetical protein [Candidatus Eisenbacteria bacterium]
MAKLVRTLVLIAVLCLIALGALLWRANRPFTSEVPVLSSSRLTAGNALFPSQLALYPRRVVHYKPRIVGHVEEAIAVEQIALVRVKEGVFFSDLFIETSGGAHSIICRGLEKKKANRIRLQIHEAIEASRTVDSP